MSSIHAPTVETRPEDGDQPYDTPPWHTIPATEIAARGLSAVDPLLADGPVYVTVENGRGYVIMSEALFEEWRGDRHETYVARVRAALAEVAAGKAERYDSVEALMAAIDATADSEDE